MEAKGKGHCLGLIPAHAGKTGWPPCVHRSTGAHPRSRGENQVQVLKAHFGDGSSPLTRGKLPVRGGLAERLGLIPAHAGKTTIRVRVRKSRKAHPRSRGENVPIQPLGQVGTGSSPLTRGKPSWRRRRVCSLGLIPAHAGKTHHKRLAPCQRGAHPRSRGENDSLPGCTTGWEGSSPLTRGKLWHLLAKARGGLAHPRSRGENSKLQTALNEGRGSSPLTRGKRSQRPAPGATRRLIPAHAGKTGFTYYGWNDTGAHPRSRGENLGDRGQERRDRGSSPLTRGKPERMTTGAPSWGLIPAHAGKTTPPPEAREPLWAHPRSRGENCVVEAKSGACEGSSPLTRGKRHPLRSRLRERGLIPAHAGKTPPTPRPAKAGQAHPRSRGENLYCGKRGFDGRGSSPLTRGKLGKCNIMLDNDGLIPAHAGKTSAPCRSRPGSRAHPRSRGENK